MPSRTSRARREQVLRLRRAGERAGQAADDQHQARRAERRGLVDRAPVVVERGAPAGRVRRREHAAAAVARQRRARGRAPARRCASRPIAATWSRHGEMARMPWRAHASMIVSSVPGAAQRRGVDREPAVVGGEVAHGDRRRPVSRRRRAARAGASCARRPAPAARAGRPHRRAGTASARCSSERALCWPPTIVKCDWWPFSQARKTMPVL